MNENPSIPNEIGPDRRLRPKRPDRPGVSLFLGATLAAAALSGRAVEEPARPAPPTNELSIRWVVSQVLADNPSLKAARAAAESMQARVPQARAWEDPRVGVDLERSGTSRLDTLTDAEWMAGQEVPVSGKNRWRGRAASAEAEAALAELHRRELDLAARAQAGCYRLANDYVQLELNQNTEILLRRFAEVSRLKYESGMRSQADVLTAETELTRTLEARRDIEQRLVEEQSQINVLLNRPPGAPLGRPGPVAMTHLNLSPDAMQEAALQHRPEIVAARKKIEAAKARRTVARRAWIPDPELRIEARQFNGAGGGIQEYDTGIFFTFPWVNRGKYKAAIAEAEKIQESGEHELAAVQAETRGMVRTQVEKIDALHHHYMLYRDRLLPLARQAVDASEIAYRNDRGTLLELLSAQRSARDAESAMNQHLTDYLAAVADLESMVGAAPPATPQP